MIWMTLSLQDWPTTGGCCATPINVATQRSTRKTQGGPMFGRLDVSIPRSPVRWKTEILDLPRTTTLRGMRQQPVRVAYKLAPAA